MESEYLTLEMLHETNAQEDGTIERDTQFIDDVEDWVLSWPALFRRYALLQDAASELQKQSGLRRTRPEYYFEELPSAYELRTRLLPGRIPPSYTKSTLDERGWRT